MAYLTFIYALLFAQSAIDALYQTALARIDSGTVEENLAAFQQILAHAPDYAPAHHQLAKLYSTRKTPNDYQRAERALKQAIALDRKNIDYQLALADLMWQRGFRFNAERQYKKVLKQNPRNPQAAYAIGMRALKHYFKYRDMEDYDQLGNSATLRHWGHFAKKDRKKAIHVDPGTYHLIGEMVERQSKSIGTFQAHRHVQTDDRHLVLSDLLLSSHIAEITDMPENRYDLKIHPNPVRTFTHFQPVYIYFEIYNLSRDDFGSTHFQIAYHIERPEAKTFDPVLFSAVDFAKDQGRLERRAEDRISTGTAIDYQVRYVPPKSNRIKNQIVNTSEEQTAITVDYTGNRPNDFTYLQIDVSQVPAGIHQLTVVVRDIPTNQTAKQQTIFRIVE